MDLVDKINKAIANGEYECYGIRYEDATREVGDEVGASRHNPDRDDEREFPEYNSSDYLGLPELDGASAWEIDETGCWMESICGPNDTLCNHAYIIGGDMNVTHDDADAGEVVIGDAVVVEVLF